MKCVSEVLKFSLLRYSNFCFSCKHRSYLYLPWVPFSGNRDIWSGLNFLNLSVLVFARSGRTPKQLPLRFSPYVFILDHCPISRYWLLSSIICPIQKNGEAPRTNRSASHLEAAGDNSQLGRSLSSSTFWDN